MPLRKGLVEVSLLFFLFLISFLFFNLALAEDFYFLIDKGSYKLFLKREDEIIFVAKIGYGLKSFLSKSKRGDFLTPEGIYEISDIRPSQQYYYFFELNYPNFNDLSLAYFRGEITLDELKRCEKERKGISKMGAINSLGSKIGIHGGGAYKKEKGKENYHWTQGCIALDNKDLEKILKWAKPYQKVYIIDSNKPLFEVLKKLAYPKRVKPFDFWEGSLYLKVDEKTYWYFKVIEKYNAQKYLEWKEWVRGALNQRKIAAVEGKFEEMLENFLKEVLMRRINYIFDPMERQGLEEWK